MKKPLPAFMQNKMNAKDKVNSPAKKGNPFGGMKGGGCTKKMATGGLTSFKNANRTGGDLSGKLTKSSTGEGVEKGYKASTKVVKSKGADGIAQRGRTKPQASKEM